MVTNGHLGEPPRNERRPVAAAVIAGIQVRSPGAPAAVRHPRSRHEAPWREACSVAGAMTPRRRSPRVALLFLTLTEIACSGGGAVRDGASAGTASSGSAGTGGTGTGTASSSNAAATGGGGAGSVDAGPSPTSMTAAFRTQTSGQYLSATCGGGSNVMATAEGIGPDEIFVLTDLDGGALTDGHQVRLAAAKGPYLSAVNGGGGALLAGVLQPGDDETFVLHRVAGPGAVADGDAIALEALHQVEYLSADQGGGSVVGANEPHALSWETFTLTLNPAPASPALVAHDRVICTLATFSGQRTIAGQHDKLNDQPEVSTDQIQSITGKLPGLWSADFGFGSEGVDNRAGMIAEAENQWSQGAVVQLMYHNCIPTGDELCSWDDIGGATPQHLTDAQWSSLVTDGTALNQAWKGRLDTLSPFFADLQAKGVAPLFRPLHEMNQGIFWWAGRPGPTGTTKLFQITHDYLVGQKGFTNIVWVWDLQDFGTLSSDVNDYDPGPGYYDIAALDVYDGSGYTTDKYDLMTAKAGSKLFAVGECEHPPTGDVLAAQPGWVFFMLWPDFIAEDQADLPAIYAAPQVVTLGQMPGWL